MSYVSTNFADAVAAFARGELDSHEMSKIVDAQLAKGQEAEVLQDLISAAKRSGDLDTEMLGQLMSFVADSKTVFVGEPSKESDKDDSKEATEEVPAVVDSPTQIREPEELVVGALLRKRFIIDEVLGTGGMGTVYKGRDINKIQAKDRNPYLAIKVLNEDFAKRPDAFVALQREASRQQRLAHPNIATVFDFDRSGKIFFIIMELLQGRTLDKFIRSEVQPKKGLALEEAMPIIESFCAALKYAHDRSVVHADFKPGNCFISDEREVKVLDFGIARAIKDPNSSAQDQTLFDPRSIGALTPTYASPEMIENSAPPDPRDDIYAVGCVVFELLTGAHPFKRVPATEARNHGMEPPRIKSLSRRQNKAMARALAFERADRTPNISEFLAELRPQETNFSSRLSLVALPVLIVAVLAVLLFNHVETLNRERILDNLKSSDPAVVMKAIDKIEEQKPGDRRILLQDARNDLLEFFRLRYEALMAAGPEHADFKQVESLLSTGSEFYRDSAQLYDLRQQFDRSRSDYLSNLSEQFEKNLVAERLLPRADEEDFPEIYARLVEIDPINELLSNDRIAEAYEQAARSKLDSEHLDSAEKLVAQGLTIVANNPTLMQVKAEIDAAAAERQRQQRLDNLVQQLEQRANGVKSSADLAGVAETSLRIRELDAKESYTAEASEIAMAQLKPQIDALFDSGQLAPLEAFLDQQEANLSVLGQDRLVARLSQRRDALVDRRKQLNEQILNSMTSTELVAKREKMMRSALEELDTIDPAFLKETRQRQRIIQVQLSRVDSALANNDWGAARDELKLASSFNRDDAMEAQLAAKSEEISRQERAYANMQEAERQAAQERKLRSAIAAAEQNVKQRLSVDITNKSELNDLRQSLAELRQIDKSNALLASAYVSATEKLLDAAGRSAAKGNYEQAFQRLELAESIAPDTEIVKRQKERLRVEQHATLVQQRLDAFKAEISATDKLEEDKQQARVLKAFAALTELKPTAALLTSAGKLAIAAALRRGEELLNDTNFDAVESVHAFAANFDSNNPELQAARTRLAAEREALQRAEANKRLNARLAAARRRYDEQVAAVRLTNAAETLAEIEKLAPGESSFIQASHRQLANEYADYAQTSIARRRYDQAESAIKKGILHDRSNTRFGSLRTSLEAERISARIESWITNTGVASVSAVRDWLQQLRQLTPDYADRRRKWAAAASERLNSIRNDRDKYNSQLELFQQVWPDQPALARLKAIPTAPKKTTVPGKTAVARAAEIAINDTPSAPTPSDGDSRAVPAQAKVKPLQPLPPDPEPGIDVKRLIGKWCSDGVGIEFANSKFSFILQSGQTVSYSVDKYAALDDNTLVVNWRNSNRKMQTEFGSFSPDLTRMVQLRGREAGEKWQRYDRNFWRCR